MENVDNPRRDEVRAMLTPEVNVCGDCQTRYKEYASCSSCGQNMLSPGYSGMIYECPLCSNIYCENCWQNKEDSHP
jgi:hypothetical protein